MLLHCVVVSSCLSSIRIMIEQSLLLFVRLGGVFDVACAENGVLFGFVPSKKQS